MNLELEYRNCDFVKTGTVEEKMFSKNMSVKLTTKHFNVEKFCNYKRRRFWNILGINFKKYGSNFPPVQCLKLSF